MKLKMYFVMLAIGLMSFAMQSCSDDESGASVPTELENAFVNEFGNLQHNWATRGSYYVAGFTDKKSNTNAEAWFNNNGEWLMTETDIRYDALPLEVKDALEASEYATWKTDDVDMLQRKGMETIYVIEVELGHQEMDLYFDAMGNLLKTVSDTDDDSEDYLPVELPEVVKTFLNDEFAGYKLLEVEKEDDGTLEVDIWHGNDQLEVIFDSHNEWVATVKDVPMAEVPEIVKQAALDKYPGTTLEDDEAEWVETVDGDYYVIELEAQEGEFDVKVTAEGVVL